MSHTPVLLQSVIQHLNIQPNRWYIDATLGSGGHTIAILKSGGNVLGIDQSPQAIAMARTNVETQDLASLATPPKYILTTGNFANLSEIAGQEHLEQISGILFDLGYSSDQLANPSLGLSFQIDSPLDMRLSPDLGVTAADLINSLPETKLIQLFQEYGDEPRSKAIAKLIIQQRPLNRTSQLAKLAMTAYQNRRFARGIHPATKIFQALRIAVNNEFENLSAALPQAVDLLEPGGRLAVISFHSGEDRIVKQFIQQHPQLKSITDKPIIPNDTEINQNPRSRSAKLRIAEKN